MSRQSPWGHAVLVIAMAASLGGCGDSDNNGVVVTAPPNPPPRNVAAEGERAFFATLHGTTMGEDETIALLESAVRDDPTDGRSYFLLGMTHMFRFARNVADYHNVSAALQQEIAAAQAALDHAVPLQPQDRRVPGFRGAATFTHGIASHDTRLTTLGLTQLRESIALYPEFNNFSFMGTVGNVVAPTDPLFSEALGYVGDPLKGSCTPFTEPEICGNAGKAPHNVEGALLLFGDLFAKNGDVRQARFYYQLSLSFATNSTWRFKSVVENRLQTVAQRVALYADDDPSNDPPLAGYRDEACAMCHFD